MAGSRGAADLVHGGQDVADEGDGGRGGGPGAANRDRYGGGEAAGVDGEGAVSGSGRSEVAVVAALDGGAGGVDFGFAGEVDALAAFEDARDEELAAVAGVVEGELGGVDEEVDGGCGARQGGGEAEEKGDGAPGETSHLPFTSIRALTGTVV